MVNISSVSEVAIAMFRLIGIDTKIKVDLSSLRA